MPSGSHWVGRQFVQEFMQRRHTVDRCNNISCGTRMQGAAQPPSEEEEHTDSGVIT